LRSSKAENPQRKRTPHAGTQRGNGPVSGKPLLKHQEIPIADVLIAFPVELGEAAYVVMDDSHYKILGI